MNEYGQVKIGFVSNVIDPQPDHRAPALVQYGDGFPYIGIRDVKSDGTVNVETARMINEEPVIKQEQSFKIEDDDIVFCKVGTLGLPRMIQFHCRIALSATLVLIKSKKILPKYLLYTLDSEDIYSQIKKIQTGSTRQALGIQQIRKFKIPNPNYETQKQIADFLDKETTRIDALIAKKQRQIELLHEKRQAIITQAVTKGLNPDVTMKDSGVEWIGKIPEGWEVKKLRYIGTCQNGISKGGEYFGSGFPFVSYGDVYNNVILPEEVKGKVESSDSERENCSVQEGDLFFTRTSETIEEIGIVSTCLKTIPDAVFAGFLIRVRPKKGLIENNYSKYYFRSDIHRKYFVKEMNIVTRASLGQELLKNLPVILPPLNEMSNIGEYLDKQIDINMKTINLVIKSINLLKEYRSSLITHVVSGQIDISKYEVSK